MAKIYVPALLRPLVAGTEAIEVEGATLDQVLENAQRSYPELLGRLYADGQPKSGITIAVDSAVVKMVLEYPVSPNSEIHFILAIGGGVE